MPDYPWVAAWLFVLVSEFGLDELIVLLLKVPQHLAGDLLLYHLALKLEPLRGYLMLDVQVAEGALQCQVLGLACEIVGPLPTH